MMRARFIPFVGAVMLSATGLIVAAGPAMATGAQTCDVGDAHRSVCAYYQNDVALFDAPGVTGWATLDLVQHDLDHGTDSDGLPNRAPDVDAGHDGAGYQQVATKGGGLTGVEGTTTFSPAQAPFGPQDTAGYFFDVPEDGENTFTATGSRYLFTDQQEQSDSHAENAVVSTRIYDRPLTIAIHNSVPGLTFIKDGPEISGGILMDPKATDQDTPGAALVGADDHHSGTVYFGGYRSGESDASVQVSYTVPSVDPAKVNDPTDPAVLYAGYQVQLDLVQDQNDPTAQESTCTVNAASSQATLQCSVSQSGSNDGQSSILVSITRP